MMRRELRGFAILVGSGAMLVSAACATATDASPDAAGAAQAAVVQTAAVDGDKRVCKRTTPIGSNVPQRVCATEAEWAAREKSDRDQLDDLDRSMRSAGAPTMTPR